MKKICILFVAVTASLAAVSAVSVGEDVVDTVVAVVGDEIILLSELQKQVSSQMMAKGLDLNSPRDVLMKLRDEILEGMIDDRLLVMKAQQDSIEIDAREVDRELKRSIAALKQRYGSEEAYRKGLEEYGLTEVQLRKMYSDAIAKNFLLERLQMDLSRHISVTPQDMEAWIAARRDSLPKIPEKFKLSHILVYPRVSEERKKAAREKLRGILERARNGEDFAELAKKYSEDPGTRDEGGFIDWFTRNSGYDPDFTEAAFSLQKGEISDIVETIYGYHIIKCEDIRGERIQARHILIRLVPNEDDEKRTVEKLKEIRGRILSGEKTFEEMAKEYSEDENSRDLGGKLDWITSERGMSNSGIPSFIEQARKLEIGGISEPFKSQFGYHIIRLDGYQPPHEINIRDDRLVLEGLIRQKKFLDEYNKIIKELRSKTYIDVRL